MNAWTSCPSRHRVHLRGIDVDRTSLHHCCQRSDARDAGIARSETGTHRCTWRRTARSHVCKSHEVWVWLRRHRARGIARRIRRMAGISALARRQLRGRLATCRRARTAAAARAHSKAGTIFDAANDQLRRRVSAVIFFAPCTSVRRWQFVRSLHSSLTHLLAADRHSRT